MVDLSPENLQRMNKEAETAFIQRANTLVKDTLITVYNLSAGRSNNDNSNNSNNNKQSSTQSATAQNRASLYKALSHIHTEEQIDQFTQLGIKRARGHRLITIGEILDYLWLMCWLGAYFDIDQHHSELHEYINPTDEQLKTGITVHATDQASTYIQILNTPRNAMEERLKGIKADLLEARFAEQTKLEHPITKSTLTHALNYYMPMNKAIHDQENKLQAIYKQCQPQGLNLNTPNSHMAWFMLTLDKGYRFYDNPLYPNIKVILTKHSEKNTQIQEAEKIASIIDQLLAHPYKTEN